MDRITQYRQIIETVLTETLAFLNSGSDPGIEYKLLFDRERDAYALIVIGFSSKRRIHHFLIHLEIIHGKVWLQADNTDFEIAKDLEKAGLSRGEIVLGFQEPKVRPYTEYAAA